MKKFYCAFLYFIFFVPMGTFYKWLRKPILIENPNFKTNVVLMAKESERNQPTIFLKLLENIVPKHFN